ncbi:MAG TPA: A24 family peptidase, partial [Patescibacteria group bacterium]|nr:A24 family peptidase [Patescibacteria group bacterium]
ISWQYPAVEFVTAVLFLYSFYLYYTAPGFDYLVAVRNWFIIAVLIVVFVYDLRWQLILDKVMLPSILVVTGLNLFLGVSWWVLVISAIIGGSFFFLQFLVSGGKWIGGGDIRLGIFMGAALAQIPLLLFALFSSYLVGSVVGITLIASRKKQWGSQVPLGVFLALGTILALFWGDSLVTWYLDILG